MRTRRVPALRGVARRTRVSVARAVEARHLSQRDRSCRSAGHVRAAPRRRPHPQRPSHRAHFAPRSLAPSGLARLSSPPHLPAVQAFEMATQLQVRPQLVKSALECAHETLAIPGRDGSYFVAGRGRFARRRAAARAAAACGCGGENRCRHAGRTAELFGGVFDCCLFAPQCGCVGLRFDIEDFRFRSLVP